MTNVKDELTDLSAKVDNMSLDLKDIQSEAHVQRKMMDSQMAQWVTRIYSIHTIKGCNNDSYKALDISMYVFQFDKVYKSTQKGRLKQ